ncbi:MAG: YfcE family phosphodiesterase, partial [Monoglobales bacterium]
LEDVFPEKKHFFVSGNCDFFDTEPSDKAFEIEGFKFFITHGHPYGVKTSLDRLISHAKENKVDCVLFGHTHIPICEKIDGMLILNPGSARQSFGIIEIEDGKINGCTMDVY